jgi:hypothetical protein
MESRICPLSLLLPEPVGKAAPAQRQAGSQGREAAKRTLDGRRAVLRCAGRLVEVDAGGLLLLVGEAVASNVIRQRVVGLLAKTHPGGALMTGSLWRAFDSERHLKSRWSVSGLCRTPGGTGRGLGSRLGLTPRCPHVSEIRKPGQVTPGAIYNNMGGWFRAIGSWFGGPSPIAHHLAWYGYYRRHSV